MSRFQATIWLKNERTNNNAIAELKIHSVSWVIVVLRVVQYTEYLSKKKKKRVFFLLFGDIQLYLLIRVVGDILGINNNEDRRRKE